MEYKYSYVAYLDILGFKDLSNDSANVAREIKINDEKARAKQLRRDN